MDKIFLDRVLSGVSKGRDRERELSRKALHAHKANAASSATPFVVNRLRHRKVKPIHVDRSTIRDVSPCRYLPVQR